MASNDEVFQTVEGYKEMTVPQLTQSKIGKVMNRIVKLTHIPLEEQYHFKERAQALCDRWKVSSDRDTTFESDLVLLVCWHMCFPWHW